MKKIFSLFSALLFSAALFAQEPISDPNVEVREAKDFHAIHVGSAFKVILTQGGEDKVAVSAADKKDLSGIVVEVRKGVLYVGWDNKIRWNRGNKKLKAYISFKSIDELNVSGATDVDIEGTLDAKGKDFNLELSGASDVMGRIDNIKKLKADLSGASDAQITGRAQEMTIDASGASKFKGFEFIVDVCDIDASGASAVKITVNKELSAKASGASAIGYKGSGVIKDIRTSGASSISRS